MTVELSSQDREFVFELLQREWFETEMQASRVELCESQEELRSRRSQLQRLAVTLRIGADRVLAHS